MYNTVSRSINFITICAQGHKCLFGDISRSGAMELSEAGKIVERLWNQLPKKFLNIELDQFVVMPNHIHGIVVSIKSKRSVLAGMKRANDSKNQTPIAEIIRTFKVESADLIHTTVTRKFEWQRNYTLELISTEDELIKIRKEIKDNPVDWDFDPENTAKRGSVIEH